MVDPQQTTIRRNVMQDTPERFIRSSHADNQYWLKRRMEQARYSWDRARHKLRMGDRFGHRWHMCDALFYLKLAKERKAAMQ